jgi:rfaE bifunctional protein nucleotidyltransferase chain/domain
MINDKIISLSDLAKHVAAAQAEGQKVVMAGGVFDIFHYGHLRHLQAARNEGNRLFVAVTADVFAGKAPGRPVFNENMRTEMVAAQGIVDWVIINHNLGAEEIIEAARPDVYVKGSEYTNPEDDVTGRIVSEKEAVESYGGRIAFTNEATFSSSSLINKHIDIFDPPLRDFLSELRKGGGLDHLVGLIEKVRDYKVLMIGDTIIDEYVYVNPLGKAPKENIIATLYEEGEVFAGGVIAAANHLASICGSVDVVTVLGGGDSYRGLVEESVKKNVNLTLLERPFSPTTRKQRFVEPTYVKKMFEVYFMDDSPLPSSLEEELNLIIDEKILDYDLVVVTDFGHGMIQPSTIRLLSEKAPFLAVNAQSNSANLGYNLITRYENANFICIDEHEARLAVGNKFTDLPELVSEKLSAKTKCGKIIVTQGSDGCIVYEDGSGEAVVPAVASSPIDTVGAGDAFFAIAAPIAASGASMKDVGFIGNIAGGIKIGIVGHRRSIDKVDLIKTATTLLK